MPGWEPFDMGGTSTWPLPVVVPSPAAVNVVVYELVSLTTTEDS